MNFTIPINNYTLVAGAVLVLILWGMLVHYWPSIKTKVTAFMPRLSKELDRESGDLDAFVKKSHDDIDSKIADLQTQKKRIADAAAVVKKLAG
jgi:hypothetical protein